MGRKNREARRLAEIHARASAREHQQHNPSGDSKYARKQRGVRTPASLAAEAERDSNERARQAAAARAASPYGYADRLRSRFASHANDDVRPTPRRSLFSRDYDDAPRPAPRRSIFDEPQDTPPRRSIFSWEF